MKWWVCIFRLAFANHITIIHQIGGPVYPSGTKGRGAAAGRVSGINVAFDRILCDKYVKRIDAAGKVYYNTYSYPCRGASRRKRPDTADAADEMSAGRHDAEAAAPARLPGSAAERRLPDRRADSRAA